MQARISPRKNAHRYDELASGLLVGEYDATGTLIQETVWLGDIPIATLRPNGATVSVLYVHTDQLNTPRQITRPSDNAAMWTWNSDPFGTDAANPNPAGAGAFAYNLRFPGQVFDGQAGLHQNGRRDYDPAIGRYAQSDPIGLWGGINTYAYVHQNPLGRIDPLGLCDDEKQRCKQVKEDALEHCSERLPTTDFGFQFWNCVNQYIEDHGCGPGGTPLPQPTPEGAPAPRAPRGPNRQATPASPDNSAILLLALLALLGVAATSP